MAARVDPALLPDLLGYNPDTGELTWRERPAELFPSEHRARVWNSKHAGKAAFTTVSTTDGYKYGMIFGRTYASHRVIWALVTGRWPADQIDHINHDRADNRLDNLREVVNQQNAQNQSLRSDNKTGFVGVRWSKPHRKWVAHARRGVGGNYLGIFGCFGKALKARKAAEKELGFHPNHGKGQTT